MKLKSKILLMVAFVIFNAPSMFVSNVDNKTQLSVISVSSVQAQNVPPNITSIKTQVKTQTDGLKDIIMYVIGAVLGIALIFVIWMIASQHPKAKEAGIGMLVAIIFYGLAWSLIY